MRPTLITRRLSDAGLYESSLVDKLGQQALGLAGPQPAKVDDITAPDDAVLAHLGADHLLLLQWSEAG